MKEHIKNLGKVVMTPKGAWSIEKEYEILDYKVTPLKADHAKNLDPVIYIIEKESKAILYAHDTELFPEETWAYLKAQNVRFGILYI